MTFPNAGARMLCAIFLTTVATGAAQLAGTGPAQGGDVVVSLQINVVRIT
jgi:hypothetical protein